MDLWNSNLLNKYICSYIAMRYKYNLVKWVADKGILLARIIPTVLLQRIFDLMHFDEVSRNNLLGLFNSCVFYIKEECEWQ